MNNRMLKKHFLKQSQQSGSMNTLTQTKPAPNQSQLEELGQSLRHSLQRRSPWLQLQVQCAVKQSTLLVLIEHLLHIEPDPELTFGDLEDALIEQSEALLQSGFTQSIVGNSRSLPVRAYIRISGYQQPYATDTFPVEPQPAETESSNAPQFVQPASLEPLAPELALAPEIPEPIAAEPEPIAAELVAPEPEPEPIAAEPEPIAAEPIAPEPEPIVLEPEPEPIAPEPEPIAAELVAPEPEPEPIAAEPEPIAAELIAPEPEPIAPEPEPEPIAAELVAPEPEPIAAEPEPEPIAAELVAPEPEPIAAEPIAPEPEPEPEPEPIALEPEPIAAEPEPEPIALEPIAPEPEPEPIAAELIAPEPEPIVPEPELVAPEPEPIAAEPEPELVAPEPEPIAAEPEPIVPSLMAEPKLETELAVPEWASTSEHLAEQAIEPHEFESVTVDPAPPGIEAVDLAAQPSADYLLSSPWDTTGSAVDLTLPISPSWLEATPEAIVDHPSTDHPSAEPIAAIAPNDEIKPDAIAGVPAIEPNQSNPSEPVLDNPFVLLGEIELESTEPEPPAVTDNPLIELPDSYLFDPTTTLPANHQANIVSPSSELDLWSQSIEPPIEEPPIEESPTTIMRSSESSVVPRERQVIVVEQLVQPSPRSRWSASGVMLTGSVGLFALVSSTYALTRPCVLGSTCEPLEKAQQLDQQASQTIASTDSALKVAEAYHQLDQARQMLSTIPIWSSQYKTAQALQSTYGTKAEVVGRVVRALKQANAAALQSQNPPHPVQYWRKIQLTWREAIALLEKVPSNSPVAALAHRKLQDYQANLSQTDARVITEQDAQEKVTTARNTAQVAETKAGLASSPESWQQVYLTWEAAIALLMQIPEGTMAQVEAKQLIPSYQTKMAEASQRRLQEAASTGSLQDAINSAEQARSLEQKNQWQPAIDAWQTALDTVQKIPQGTSYYLQAQALIGEYQTALTQAKESQRRLSAMQAIKPDLSRICGGTLNVCTYTFAPEAVRVQITAQYDQVVESHINTSQLRGNFSARSEVVNQVNQLLQAAIRSERNGKSADRTL